MSSVRELRIACFLIVGITAICVDMRDVLFIVMVHNHVHCNVFCVLLCIIYAIAFPLLSYVLVLRIAYFSIVGITAICVDT